jgi:hypothetical protein
MCDYCLAPLPSSSISAVRELACHVRNSAVDDPHKQLEAKLNSSYQTSPGRKAFELLDLLDLSDRWPPLMD